MIGQKYGETIAWHLAKQAFLYINETGELPPNFFNSLEPQVLMVSPQGSHIVKVSAEVLPADLSGIPEPPRQQAVNKLVPTSPQWTSQPRDPFRQVVTHYNAGMGEQRPTSTTSNGTTEASFGSPTMRDPDQHEKRLSPLPNLLLAPRQSGNVPKRHEDTSKANWLAFEKQHVPGELVIIPK